MTNLEKVKIDELKHNGKTANMISKELSISLNTVKSYLRRNKINNSINYISDGIHCLHCGELIIQNSKTKKRKFCSINCKKEYYKNHSEYLNKKALYEIECKCCHKIFKSYGNKHRKYCSHNCYIISRFKNAVQNI